MTRDRERELTFVTPYLEGAEMMRLHLASVRTHCPDAPILVSKAGGGKEEMEGLRRDFAIEYWLEECNYPDALLRLLDRCRTRYVCIMDHDTVLLGSPLHLLAELGEDRWDLVGIEERIRESPAIDWERTAPEFNGWMRFAPGYMDATFLMFDLRRFKERWGLRGVGAPHPEGTTEAEYHYGICERLPRHKYLRPFHAAEYGMGNLIKDADTVLLWHQWYGAHTQRLFGAHPEVAVGGLELRRAVALAGQAAFLRDYPDLRFDAFTPAWGPELDIEAERRRIVPAYPSRAERLAADLRRFSALGLPELARRLRRRLQRWWLLRRGGAE